MYINNTCFNDVGVLRRKFWKIDVWGVNKLQQKMRKL